MESPFLPRRTLKLAVVPLVILGVIALSGGAFYLRARVIMEAQLKEHLRDTAAMAAMAFDPATVDAVKGGDIDSTELASLVRTLRAVRDIDGQARFAYILRRTEDPSILEFVADADSLSTTEELDVNGNGTVESDEEPSLPGDSYDISDIAALQNRAFAGPAVDEEITVDQWGPLISGYAPIHRADGSVAGVLGIDLSAETYLAITQSVLSPVGLLVVLLTAVVIAGYVALEVRKPRMEMLKQIDAERGALMSLASHQLGGPLATFKWWLEILREHKSDISKEEIGAQMEEGVRRMERIMNALQSANQISSGKVAYNARAVSLNDVVRAITGEVGMQLKLHDDRLCLDLDESIGAVRIDSELIGGAVQELVENAVAYSPDHSRITVRTKRAHGTVMIEVEDHGYGIPKNEQSRIFEKFTRGKDAPRLKPYGNGLGLYIVRSIATLAGGKAELQSEAGKGSRFTITLPHVA